MAAPPAPIVLDLSTSYGAILISDFIAVTFWGMTCIQTFIYYVSYPKDPWYIKFWAAALWIIDTIHQILIVKGIWSPLISQYGDLENLGVIHDELLWQLVVTGIVAIMAQLFFVYRIYRFSGDRWYVPAIIIPGIVWQPIGIAIYVAKGVHFHANSDLNRLSKYTFAVNGTAAAVDIVIAIMMVTLLYIRRTPTSERLIFRLMLASVNTGFWTAVFALITVSFLAGRPNDLIYAGTYFPLCPLYCNTILGNLNSRHYMRSTRGPGLKSSTSAGGRGAGIGGNGLGSNVHALTTFEAAPGTASKMGGSSGDESGTLSMGSRDPNFEFKSIHHSSSEGTYGYDDDYSRGYSSRA